MFLWVPVLGTWPLFAYTIENHEANIYWDIKQVFARQLALFMVLGSVYVCVCACVHAHMHMCMLSCVQLLQPQRL